MQQIDSDIPIPELTFRKGPPDRYPFRDLKIGESFVVQRATRLNTKPWSDKTGYTFSVRRIAKGAWRVWRVQGANDAEV